MWNPTASRAICESLQHIVFDEIHLLESITGANSAMVIRRIMAGSGRPNDIMMTGSTATVADERGHIGKVFARNQKEVVVSTPESGIDKLELTGLIHHVIHKSKEGQNFQGDLANLSSLVCHVRRKRRSISSDEASTQKTIGFADSLQLLGNWNYLLRDLEGLEFRDDVHKRLNKNHGYISQASHLALESRPFRSDLINHRAFCEC